MPKFLVDKTTEIFYEDIGSGPPVLMIHSAAGSGRAFVEDFAPAYKTEYRLLIVDLRGLGQSSRVRGAMPPDAWVTDCIRLLDDAAVERVHIIGSSLGARVGGRLATVAPERVASLTVNNPILEIEPAGDAQLNASFSEIAEESAAARRYRATHGEDWREVVAWYSSVRNDPELQTYLNLRHLVSKIAAPTLITRSDSLEDVVHPLAHAYEWHAAAPSSWLFIAPNRGAGVLNGEEFKSVYARFMQHVAESIRAS